MAGYTRQSAADIVAGQVIKAAPVHNEFQQVQTAFAALTGHKHDGTTGEGAYVPLIADADALNKVVVDTANNRVSFYSEVSGVATEQLRIQDGAIVPVTDDDIDLGASGAEFKDLYIDGIGYIDSVVITGGTIDDTVIGGTTPAAGTFTTAETTGNTTVGGNLSVTGTSTFTDPVTAGSLTTTGTATLADVDINGGAIDGTTIGATSTAAGNFTTVQTSGQADLASANIDGGTIDGTVIGGTSAQAITGTTVTATTGFVGDLTGSVTGNITGDITGDVTGNVTGDLTGNVTASTGSSTFNNVTVNGTLDVTGTTIANVTDPTSAQDAATKNYVDTNDALKLNLTGGTMSGDITMGSNTVTGLGTPTNTTDAATKDYVDTNDALKLNLAGGTMSGDILMGGNTVTGLAAPNLSSDAATKGYVDAEVSSLVDAAPGALDTLNELAAAINDDANFSTTITNSIATKLPLAGGTMSGDIAMGTNSITGMADPTLAQDAATKAYVDSNDDLKLNLSGGTMTGPIDMGSSIIATTAVPSQGSELTNKTYVDGRDALKLNLSGGTMSGTLNMGNQKIADLATPTLSTDASTKGYVDTQDDLKLNLTGGTMTGAIVMNGNKITANYTPTTNYDLTTKVYVDNILGSATAAATSAAAAATSETNAATSETNAANSATAAANSYDAFDDRYLGAKSSDPSTDNDGDALLTGALYWSTTTNSLRVFDGTNWDDAAFTLGSALTRILDDTNPTLGGNLDLNSFDVTGTGDIDITGNISLTGTVDGRDVAADGTKLDGIESGATADQTPSELLTAIKSVDGASSGLDADLLDGQEGSYYLDWTNVTNKPDVVEVSGDTMTGFLTLHADPVNALHAATKEYVDTIAAAGIHYHTPVRVETPSALNATYDNGTSGVGATLTNAGTQAALVIDGVTLNSADRVLVYNQTNAAHNGVYTVTDTGSASTNWVLTRATDADSYGVSDPDAFGEGDAFFVKEGDTGAGELYVMNTAGTITFGTTAITFTVIAETAVYTAGTDITLDGTVFNLNSTIAADTTGNAATATALETGRDISLTGDVSGSATFDGTGNVSINATVAALSSKLDSSSYTASDVLTKIKTVDGSGSGLDADLWDGNQFSSYLNQPVLTSSSPTFTHTYLESSLYHSGDTDTRLAFFDNTIILQTGGSQEVIVDTTGVRLGDTGNGYFQPVTGNYGSIQIDGGSHNGYEGYSIGGRAVFMHDNSSTSGLYNDVENQWMFKATHNGSSQMHYAGFPKVSTQFYGASIEGTGAIKVPSGTTAQQPSSASVGMFRYNSTDDAFEGYTSEGWGEIGGGAAELIDCGTASSQSGTLFDLGSASSA